MNNKTKVRVWDNGGETMDRYTVAIKEKDTCEWYIYTMSSDPLWPRGVNLYSHTIYEKEITKDWGEEVDINELPKQVQKAIKQRM